MDINISKLGLNSGSLIKQKGPENRALKNNEMLKKSGGDDEIRTHGPD